MKLGRDPMLARNSLAVLASVVLVMLASGCAKEQDYYDVMNDKVTALREMTDVLKTVKDAQTMAEAKGKLEENSERYAEIARRAKALPKPPKKVEDRMREEGFIVQATFDNLRAETARISRLPGGPEFLKKFSSTEGLFSAVQP